MVFLVTFQVKNSRFLLFSRQKTFNFDAKIAAYDPIKAENEVKSVPNVPGVSYILWYTQRFFRRANRER